MGGVALQTMLKLSAVTRWRMLESNGSMFGILQPGVSTRNDDRRRSASCSCRVSSPTATLGPPSTWSDRRRATSSSDRTTAELTHRTTNVLNVTMRWNIVEVQFSGDSCHVIQTTVTKTHRHQLLYSVSQTTCHHTLVHDLRNVGRFQKFFRSFRCWTQQGIYNSVGIMLPSAPWICRSITLSYIKYQKKQILVYLAQQRRFKCTSNFHKINRQKHCRWMISHKLNATSVVLLHEYTCTLHRDDYATY